MSLKIRHVRYDEMGDPDAPPGTRPWAIAVRHELSFALSEFSSVNEHIARLFHGIVQYEAYRTLTDRDGKPFECLEAWCSAPPPFGLGRSLAEVKKASDLPAHRAAIIPGFIKDNPRVSIPMDNPEDIAKVIREHLTPDQIRELITHLEVSP